MRSGVRLESKMVPGGPALAASAIPESGGALSIAAQDPATWYLEILQRESRSLKTGRPSEWATHSIKK